MTVQSGDALGGQADGGAAAGAAADTLLFRLIPYLVIGAFVGGIVLALVVRRRRPELYARTGRIVLEDAAAERN
ncbi:hypothetical protein [Kitasatospora aureofaciens]|uniref:hypothetical protein n=1 Tax=Kitasatospora aureofaciens TaxID=1894 RepID=UPI001C485F08|nr:hypothetical protein [Kitasatospora aureofaciens]MBV6699008.1 hypothetical protein [Kitasatospora aureofaciens]